MIIDLIKKKNISGPSWALKKIRKSVNENKIYKFDQNQVFTKLQKTNVNIAEFRNPLDEYCICLGDGILIYCQKVQEKKIANDPCLSFMVISASISKLVEFHVVFKYVDNHLTHAGNYKLTKNGGFLGVDKIMPTVSVYTIVEDAIKALTLYQQRPKEKRTLSGKKSRKNKSPNTIASNIQNIDLDKKIIQYVKSKNHLSAGGWKQAPNERSGHYRRLKNGKQIWIKPYKVNQ